MGFLNFSDIKSESGAGIIHETFGKIYVYQKDVDQLAPIYGDASLKYSTANPISLDINGKAPLSFLSDGEYWISLHDRKNAFIEKYENILVRQGNTVPRDFEDVQALIGDTELSYSASSPYHRVVPGDVLTERAKGFSYRVAPSDATNPSFSTLSGVKINAIPLRENAYSLSQLGAVPGQDASRQFDEFLDFAWANYTNRFSLILPNDTVLAKDGDFALPPNINLSGDKFNARLHYGHNNTRITIVRDNDRVGTVGDVNYKASGNYWNLGPNVIENFALRSSSAAPTTAFYACDMPFTVFRNLNICDDFDVGVHMENDQYWNEFWVFDNCCIETAQSGILLSRTPTSVYESFGHGTFRGHLSARHAGGAAVRLMDGASAYNSRWDVIGFCAAPTAGTEAYVFKLEGAGTDMRHANICSKIENLGNMGAPYAISVDSDADGSRMTGHFSGVGSATRFRGVDGSDIQSTLGYRVNDSGTSIAGLNGVPLRVCDQNDVNGDNVMRYGSETNVAYTQSGQVLSGETLGLMPVSKSKRTRVVSIQISAGSAPSGNIGGGWHLGFCRHGASNPICTVVLPDGQTETFVELDYLLPAGWLDLSANALRWVAP